VQELAAAGVLVVASAGNSSGGPVEYPANCPGVVAVAGLRHVGTKVGFSSIGPSVALAAPGGNCVNITAGSPCLFSLDTTSNAGTTTPGASSYTDQFDVNVGTSFAAPSVAAIAALMHAVNGNLGAGHLRERLREGARPFPAPAPGIETCRVPQDEFDTQLECACTTDTCGAGMAHAPGAVAAALRPIAAVTVPGAVAAGQDVVLDATGSTAACNRAIVGYEWTAISGAPVINGADGALASVVAPAEGAVTVRVTVTDDQGSQDTADVTVTPTAATTATPGGAGTSACAAPITPAAPAPVPDDPPEQADSGSGGGGGGGGGGSLDPAWFLPLGLGLLARRRRRHD
jgi:serine protease